MTILLAAVCGLEWPIFGIITSVDELIDVVTSDDDLVDVVFSCKIIGNKRCAELLRENAESIDSRFTPLPEIDLSKYMR